MEHCLSHPRFASDRINGLWIRLLDGSSVLGLHGPANDLPAIAAASRISRLGQFRVLPEPLLLFEPR